MRLSTNFFCAAVALTATTATLGAQPAPAFPNPPITLDGKGININGTDGVTRINMRIRVQELFAATTESESTIGLRRTQLSVRRARLRFEGVIKDPRLRVTLHLAFARGDLDQENSGFANVLRDALVTWQFTPHLAGSFGQAKLPGNRQQLVSSAELQSPDRSPLNGLFTVDRDVGAYLAYSREIGKARYVIRGALTSGEGRNPQAGDRGLAYTTRWELLPLGTFTNGGDYIEGDLAYEPTLKIAVAGGLSHNDHALRTGGQTGPALYAPRSMTTWFADAIAKRRGVSVQAEYARRESPDPITRSGTNTRSVFAGQAVNVQASWLKRGAHWEPQARFTNVTPALATQGLAGIEATREGGIGLARYVNGHRVKMNGEFYHTEYRNLALRTKRADWTLRLGAEVGI